MRTAHTDMGGFQEILQRKEGFTERRRGRRFSLRLSCRVCPVSTESPWQGGGAPPAQRPCSITNGNTVNRVLPESPWQGGGAPPAQGPCSITNGNTVNRVLPERVEFSGTVIDISRSGVLVGLDSAQISRVLRPDGVVRVVIDLPRHPSFSQRCLECTATVVRMVTAGAQTQVAFEIGRMAVKVQDAKATATRDWLSAPIEGLIQ